MDKLLDLNLVLMKLLNHGFYQKLVGKTLGAVVGVPHGTYPSSYLVPLEGSTDGDVYGKFDVLLDQWMDLGSEK